MLGRNEFLKIGSIVFGLLGLVPFVGAQVQWLPSEKVKPTEAVKVKHQEGNAIEVCRCLFNRNWYAGGVLEGKCSIGWGGKEIKKADYELLVKSPNMQISWQDIKGFGIPAGAVVGGRENTRFSYVGRLLQADRNFQLGRIVKSKSGYEFHYGMGGKEEIAKDGFEILIANHRK